MIVANAAGVTFQQDEFDKHCWTVFNARCQKIGIVRLNTTGHVSDFQYRCEFKSEPLSLPEISAVAGFVKHLDDVNRNNAGFGKTKSSDENER